MSDWFGNKLVSEITSDDVQELVDKAAVEDQRLELKQQYDAASHREMLKDITAMANADGGYIVIGVAEQNGAASGSAPIADARQVAEAMRRSSVENIRPRIDDLGIDAVALASGGEVIVVRVPESAQKPHMVTLGHQTQFWRRYVTENREMTIEEIRSEFVGDRTARLLAELRAEMRSLTGIARQEALQTVSAEDDAVAASDPEMLDRIMKLRFAKFAGNNPFFRVCLTPMSLDRGALDTDAPQMEALLRDPPQTRKGGWTIWGMMDVEFDADGITGHFGPEQRLVVLRNGYLEFTHPARSDAFQWMQSESEAEAHPYLHPLAVCEFTVSFVRLAQAVYKQAGRSSAVVFQLDLANVTGFRLPPGLLGGGSWRRAVALGYPEPYKGKDATARVDVDVFPADADPIAYDLLARVYRRFGNLLDDVPLFDETRHFRIPRD